MRGGDASRPEAGRRPRIWPRGRRGLWAAALGALLALTAVASCRDSEEPPRFPIGEPAERQAWPEGVAAAIDSGNAAFRSGDYETARRHYAEATGAGPEVPAAWFGLYMAESALGNAAAAESALARAGDMASAARVHQLLPADTGGS